MKCELSAKYIQLPARIAFLRGYSVCIAAIFHRFGELEIDGAALQGTDPGLQAQLPTQVID